MAFMTIMLLPSSVSSLPLVPVYVLTRCTATKCDDVSCSEVLDALDTTDEPELERIEEQIDQCNEETREWREKKAEAEKSIKG